MFNSLFKTLNQLTLILIFSIFVSPVAKADFLSGLLVGSLISSHPRTIVQEHKDKDVVMIESIQHRLNQEEYSPTSTSLFFDVTGFNGTQLQSIFKVKGYDVKIKNNELVFDWTKPFQDAQLRKIEDEKETKAINSFFEEVWSYGKWILLSMFIIYATVSFLRDYPIVLEPVVEELKKQWKEIKKSTK